MKIRKIALTSVLFGLSLVAGASQATPAGFIATDNSVETQLCVTAATRTKVAMHEAIEASGWSRQFVGNNIHCNGVNLAVFAKMYGTAGVQQLLPTGTEVKIIDLAEVPQVTGRVQLSR